jgi:multidrug efflux system membrane fusion protein
MKYKYFFLFYLIVMGQIACADQFPVVVEAEVKATLSSERSGVLSGLKADAGDRVRKGQILAVVLHEDLILKKQQREAQKDYKAVQVENLTKLNAKGLVTDEELAKAKMELIVNNKEISMIESEIAHSQIRAPFSGLVVERFVHSHEWVTPGKEIVELYDPGNLRIVADIPADIALKLKAGESNTLFFPDVNQEIKAKFKVLAPQVEVRSNTIKVFWTVSAAEMKKANLMPGMKGELRIERIEN